MIGIFYDTETTGLPLFREASNDQRQPHIVQLAAILADLDSREDLASINLTVFPDGWEIPESVAAIHGITQEKACRYGIPENKVLSVFLSLWRNADIRIGHNEPFDRKIIKIATTRFLLQEYAEKWGSGLSACTMKMATPLCALPPTEKMVGAGFNKFKSPTLQEAHTILVGREFDNAHDAMADVTACMNVYFAILDKEGDEK